MKILIDKIKSGEDAYQEINSQEKLYEVFSYLFRVGDFKQYAERVVRRQRRFFTIPKENMINYR